MSLTINKKNHLSLFFLFLIFTFFFLIYLFTSSNNALNTDVGYARYEVLKSFFDNGTLALNSNFGTRGVDGRFYSPWGIGSIIVGIPFYLLGKLAGISPDSFMILLNPFFTAGTAVLIFLFCFLIGYSKKTSFFVSVFFGLATFAWPLSKQSFDHPAEMFFVLLACFLLYIYSNKFDVFYLISSALAFGFSFLIRPTSVLILPAFFVYLLIFDFAKTEHKFLAKNLIFEISVAFCVVLPFVLLSLWYNFYRFGSIFETGYGIISRETGLNFFTGTPIMTGLAGFLLSPGKGIIFYSPILILFLFSIISFSKKYPSISALFSIIIFLYYIFYSKNIFWHGDHAWGPRYILVTVPFIIIPISEIVEYAISFKKKLILYSTFCLFIISFSIQVAAISVDYQKYFLDLKINKKIDFIVASGKDIDPIIEPPEYVYFNWNLSPILSQFVFIYDIFENIGNYKIPNSPSKMSSKTFYKLSPRMNLFDFWWIYQFYNGGNKYLLLGTLFIFPIIISYTGFLIYRKIF